MTWRVSWQDYRRFRTQKRDPPPHVSEEFFEDRTGADKRKAELQSLGMTACVSEHQPRARKSKPDVTSFIEAIKAWRLHA